MEGKALRGRADGRAKPEERWRGKTLRGEMMEGGSWTGREAGPGLLTFLPLLPARLKGGREGPCPACCRAPQAGEQCGQMAWGEGLPVPCSTAGSWHEATAEKESSAAAAAQERHHHHHHAGR